MRDGRIKLTDFGLCKQLISITQTAQTFCGTPEYIAPEIYQHIAYSFPVDFWSLGIMIYEMMVLKTPFYHSHEIEIKNHVINGDFQCPTKILSDLQSLLIGLLKKNPTERFGIKQVQSHSYYSSPYSLEEIEQSKIKSPWKRPVRHSSRTFSMSNHFLYLDSTKSFP
jgi:serine/threonine protein kinase